MSIKPVFDEGKVRDALRAAGVVIPDNSEARKHIAAELHKIGFAPSLTFIANSHYFCVVPD